MKKAIIASSSIQGIFPPVKFEGNYLLDGGIVNNVPVSAIRKICDFVIACDVRPRKRTVRTFTKGLELLERADFLSSYYRTEQQLKEADFIIKPNVGGFHWANFKRFKWLLFSSIILGQFWYEINH